MSDRDVRNLTTQLDKEVHELLFNMIKRRKRYHRRWSIGDMLSELIREGYAARGEHPFAFRSPQLKPLPNLSEATLHGLALQAKAARIWEEMPEDLRQAHAQKRLQ